MAKKLTVEEQGMVVRLAKVLAKISYGPIRSNASGIASGLVRLRKDPLDIGDVDSVLGRYGCAGKTTRDTLERAGVLVESGEEGSFHLALPVQDEDEAEGTRAKGAQAEAGGDGSRGAAVQSGGDGAGSSADGEAPALKSGTPAEPAADRSKSSTGRADAGAKARRATASKGRAASGKPSRARAEEGRLEAAAPAGPRATTVAGQARPPRHALPAGRGVGGLLGRLSQLAGHLVGREEAPDRGDSGRDRFAASRAQLASKPAPATPHSTDCPARDGRPASGDDVRGAGGASGRQQARKEVAAAHKPAAKRQPGKGPASKAVAKASGAEGVKAARKLLGSGPRTLAEVSREPLHTPEATELRRKILDLDPRLWLNGWLLSFPEAYQLFESQLKALGKALAGTSRLGDGSLSCRELSYQVFADEKFLEQDGDGRKLLERMGLRDIVCTRPQPRLGLLHHVPHKRPHMSIVVTENLDPWLDIRELMYADGRKLVLGERVDGVIFGNGYLVDDARRLPEFLDSLGCDDVEILYWGDIDRAGLQIFDRLKRVAEGRFGLRPFVAAYAAMARKAAERFPDPLDNEASAQEGVAFDGLDEFCAELPEDVRDYVHAVIAGKRLVPQEILTKADL